jgi:hypothetical protein
MAKNSVILLFVAFIAGVCTQSVKLYYRKVSTTFANPIGVDYSESTNTLLLTNNYPTGAGGNFRTVSFNGQQSAFSNVAGLTDEVY